MKIAYIILAHKCPQQLLRLIDRLDSEDVCFFIHIARNCEEGMYDLIAGIMNSRDNIYMLNRHKCYWGSFNLVKAAVEGIRTVHKSGKEFDYIILLSGLDYPIKTSSQIKNYFENTKGITFMEFISMSKHDKDDGYLENLPADYEFPKGLIPYTGSQWWCMTGECMEYVYRFVNRNVQYIDYFKNVHIPSEIFFNTIVLNSPFKNKLSNNSLRYSDCSKLHPPYPAILGVEDFDNIKNSAKLFARKFDTSYDAEILDMIDEYLLNEKQ